MNIKQRRTYKIQHIEPPIQNFYGGLTKTGQSWSRNWGDDGYYQKGLPQGGERFQDNGDGTVTDLVTGLMWIKDPSELGGQWGYPGNPYTMNWYDAINNCENLEFAGYSDWRLPNIKELESIIHYGRCYPAIDTNYFYNVQSGYYWSSTLCEWYDWYVWVSYFWDGYRSSYPRDYYYYNYVRPVRGGI